MLTVAPILIPLITALLCLFTIRSRKAQLWIGVAGAVALLGVSVELLRAVHTHGVLATNIGSWQAPFGIVLVADYLGAIMVLVTAVIGLAVAIFSVADISDRQIKYYYFPLVHVLLMGVCGAFLTSDIFNLYVWFEVMLIASFVLTVFGNKPEQLEGGLKYLVLNLLASIIFLIGIGFLYGKLGTLNMADIAMKLQDHPESNLLNSTGIMLLVAFGLKAGIFPLFFWLPASYHTPSPAISALFSGLLTKVGIYAMMRANTLFFAENFHNVQTLLAFLAAATMVTGVLGAAAHFEIRRILSFHIVSQIGYMVMALAIMTPLALAGLVFYLVHHIIVKANLFLISGIIEHRHGTDDLAKLGGLYKNTPLLALLFFIPAFSLGGIPPLSGFWAKLALIISALDTQAYWLVACALVVGLLTLFSMTKIWAEAFWKAPEEELPILHARIPMAMLLPVASLCILTIYLSLFAGDAFVFAEAAAAQMLDPTDYLNAVFSLNQEAPTP